MTSPRRPVRAFLAMSLDGYIAGPGDDLAWLDEAGPDEPADTAEPPPDDSGFTEFMAGTAAMLMGRRTYDVVRGMDVPWPYGDTPVFIATSRDLPPGPTTVRPVSGTPAQMLDALHREAPGPVYVDGGQLVSAVLAAGLLTELTVTVIPTVLGGGIPLFGGGTRHDLTLREVRTVNRGSAAQLVLDV